MKYHEAYGYLLNPPHQITVALIGCGGTGSQVLSILARMNVSLQELGHPGLHVTAFDPDEVTPANVGRQLFSENEIGSFKSISMITKLNRVFGTSWQAIPEYFNKNVTSTEQHFNIYISCVDSIKSRKDIAALIKVITGIHNYDLLYWMDFGNTNNTGQVILGTLKKEKNKISMPTFDEWVKIYEVKTDPINTPSCSLAEALEKQDLLINSTLANLGMQLLWRLFREGKTAYSGVMLNLETLTTNPIPVT